MHIINVTMCKACKPGGFNNEGEKQQELLSMCDDVHQCMDATLAAQTDVQTIAEKVMKIAWSKTGLLRLQT